MLIALGGISQTSSDTACIPISQLKTAINIIEKGKVVEKELVLTKEALEVSEKRIQNKDSIISQLNVKETLFLGMIDNYKTADKNKEQIINNLEKSITLERRKSNRQKMTKWLTGISGLLLGFFISK